MTKDYADSSEILQLLSAASKEHSAVDTLFDRHLADIRRSAMQRMRPQVQARFDASDVAQETHQHARRRDGIR